MLRKASSMKKRWVVLQDKLSQKAPNTLEQRVFEKLNNRETASRVRWIPLAAASCLVLLLFVWGRHQNPILSVEEDVVQIISLDFVLQNQTFFAEIDSLDIEDAEWEILLGEAV